MVRERRQACILSLNQKGEGMSLVTPGEGQLCFCASASVVMMLPRGMDEVPVTLESV